ncbi:hypothetical protein EON65_55860 [archaeon]|nr:MAG: hypothetical protein EON65_55860 [archaeon]
MSKNSKEEELEFMSVTPDEDNDMNTHYDVDPLDERSNNAIGHWIFNQSKVIVWPTHLFPYYLNLYTYTLLPFPPTPTRPLAPAGECPLICTKKGCQHSRSCITRCSTCG